MAHDMHFEDCEHDNICPTRVNFWLETCSQNWVQYRTVKSHSTSHNRCVQNGTGTKLSDFSHTPSGQGFKNKTKTHRIPQPRIHERGQEKPPPVLSVDDRVMSKVCKKSEAKRQLVLLFQARLIIGCRKTQRCYMSVIINSTVLSFFFFLSKLYGSSFYSSIRHCCHVALKWIVIYITWLILQSHLNVKSIIVCKKYLKKAIDVGTPKES